jgi:hypothetical protein
MAFVRLSQLAILQAKILIAEQSLEYGDLTLKQITRDLEHTEQKFNDSDHSKDAQDCFEIETVDLKEQRNTIVQQIDDAVCLIKKLRGELISNGGRPYFGEMTKEMKTLGARLTLLHRLSELPGFSPQKGFTLKTLEQHAGLCIHYKVKSEHCKKTGDVGGFICSLAACHFYDMAKTLLQDSL